MLGETPLVAHPVPSLRDLPILAALGLAACLPFGAASTQDTDRGDTATDTSATDTGWLDTADVGDTGLYARTADEVCARWQAGHAITDEAPLDASGADCDPGTLSAAGIDDALARIDLFRWLAGLGPTTDDDALDADAQACANLEAWWPFDGGSPHDPPASSKCYTSEGATTAAQSNIAWGPSGPAAALDQFMVDAGNETTMGHRRWLMNPPLGPVGIGFWQTGGQYGTAACVRIFGTSGGGPHPAWTAMPNPGVVPVQVARWTWTLQGDLGGLADAGISVRRVGDGALLPVRVQRLDEGYAQPAVAWTPSGWTPEPGSTYRVTASGVTGGPLVYEVRPVTCP